MIFARRTLCSVLLLYSSISPALGRANYSVQLMGGLAPAGWSSKSWAAVADTMIGKTQAYILTDLIEDLAIKLQITDAEVRNEIDSGREALGLKPLPPPAEKKSAFDFLMKKYHTVDEEYEKSIYLPPGWTEEKLKTHTPEDVAALSRDMQERLALRISSDLEAEKANPNKGFLDELPGKVSRNISDSIHEIARKAVGLAPGVRAYKRNVAPLVAIVQLQNYDNFGFFLYRTWYKNKKAWKGFMEMLESINDAQLGIDWNGEGMEIIKDQFMMPIDEDKKLEGGSAEDCRAQFRELRAQDAIPYGLDTGVLLMANERSIKSLVDEDENNPAHVWAVDVDFNPEKIAYPDGYEGVFEVRTYALLHHLYVALGSGLMKPVDVWQLLQRTNSSSTEDEEKKHDEL